MPEIALRQFLTQDLKMVMSPLLGLSHLELELLLSQSLEAVIDFYDQNPNHPPNGSRNGNYFWTQGFHEQCRKARDQIPKSAYITEPQVIVQNEDGRYSAQFNSEIERRINDKLEKFHTRDKEDQNPEHIFTKRFSKDRSWMMERQAEIVGYTCNLQRAYVESGHVMDLQGLGRRDVADNFSLSESTVHRLTRNLTAQLPDGKVVFVNDLLPANRVDLVKGMYALGELQKDQTFYDSGKWKISDQKLRPILKERFGIDAARRTIAKYRMMVENERS